MFSTKRVKSDSKNPKEVLCKGYSKVVVYNSSLRGVEVSEREKGDGFPISSKGEREFDITGTDKIYLQSEEGSLDARLLLIK